jgi:hypothetical protein
LLAVTIHRTMKWRRYLGNPDWKKLAAGNRLAQDGETGNTSRRDQRRGSVSRPLAR